MEQYIEQTASCDRSGGKRTAYLLLCVCSVIMLVLAAVCGAAALSNNADGSLKINWIAAIGTVVFILLAALSWRKKDIFCVDYDYSYFEGTLTVCAVYNARRRKRLIDLQLGTVRVCGSTASAAYQKIAAQSGVVKYKYYAQRPLYFFLREENGRKELILLELDERMIDAVRRSKQLTRGAWQNTEGTTNSYAGLS